MKRSGLRALVLAAGYGTRLRPLTYFVPKPLLPIRGEPVVGHTLRRLANAGCEAAALNLHHLADEIPRQLGRSYYGLPLVYSREESILGTLGALFPLRDFLARAEVILLVNGDSLCRWPIESLVRHHLRRAADATLLLHERVVPGDFGGGVGIDKGGRVVQLRDAAPVGEVARRKVFAGVHILSPKLLGRLPDGEADIVAELYLPLLAEGRAVESWSTRRPWHDLGTPERYLRAAQAWGRGATARLLGRSDSVVSPLAEVAPGAGVVQASIEAGARVAEGAKVERSILLQGSTVGAGSVVRECIVGPTVAISPSSSIERRMINPMRSHHKPGPEESVLGGLVYTPI